MPMSAGAPARLSCGGVQLPPNRRLPQSRTKKAVETVPHAVDPNRAAQHGSVVMRLLDEIFPLVEGFYVDLHKNPELSHAEHRTASGADRKSTRLNSSHVASSYAVFCLKKETE